MLKSGNHVSTLTKHHRNPKCLSGNGESQNISYLDRKRHWAWTLLFDKLSPYMIAERINAVFLDPRYKFIVVENKDYPKAKDMFQG